MKIRSDLSVLLFIFGVLSILPLFLHDNQAFMHLLIMCLIYSVVAGSWDLLMGIAGIFSFAQVTFYVIGGYASAIITDRYGISPWLGITAGGGIAAVAGVLIALPCFRVRGSYVALLTFALHLLLEPLLKSDAGKAVGTGGVGGIVGIPKLSIGKYVFTKLEVIPPFYTALVISFASFLIIYKIIQSRWGLAFGAIRDSESLAISLGVNEFRYKLIVFAVSAFLTGIAGAFYGHYVGVLSARLLGLDMFLMLLVMQVIGGQNLFPGALIGAFIITITSEYLRVAGVYRLVIFGAMVVALVAVMPNGITGLINSWFFSGKSLRVNNLVQRILPGRFNGAYQEVKGGVEEES